MRETGSRDDDGGRPSDPNPLGQWGEQSPNFPREMWEARLRDWKVMCDAMARESYEPTRPHESLIWAMFFNGRVNRRPLPEGMPTNFRYVTERAIEDADFMLELWRDRWPVDKKADKEQSTA